MALLNLIARAVIMPGGLRDDTMILPKPLLGQALRVNRRVNGTPYRRAIAPVCAMAQGWSDTRPCAARGVARKPDRRRVQRKASLIRKSAGAINCGL